MGSLQKGISQINEKCTGKTGSTAILVMLFKGILWSVNVGDSRAALFQKEQKMEALSEDARPDYERYGRKVLRDGGKLKKTMYSGWGII